MAADGAPDGLQRVAVGGAQRELKPVAPLPQAVDGVIHLERRLGRQPGAERQHALRRGVARQHHGDVARDLRAIVARGPGDQDLRLREQERAEAVGLQLEFPDAGAQPRLIVGGPHARAHQQDRRNDGEAEQGERRRQHRDFLPVEVQKCGKCVEEIRGIGGRSRKQRRKCGTDQAVARQ